MASPWVYLPPLTDRSRPPYRGLDLRHIDLPHRHHRGEGTFGDVAALGHGVGQDARGDLPRQPPFVLAPAACAFRAAIADDRVPVAVGLGLVVGGDLEGERLIVLEHVTAVEAEARHAADRE